MKEGLEIPKGWHLTRDSADAEYLKYAEARQKFEQEEEKRVESLTPEAIKKYESVRSKLLNFYADNDCYISYVMKGDTYGIYEDYLYIVLEIDDISFRFNLYEERGEVAYISAESNREF